MPLCLATNLKEAPPCSIHLLALAHLSDLLITEYLANLLVLSIDQRSAPVNSGDADSISESGRSPREGNANLLQYSCLENSMNREACGPQPPGSQREGAHRHVASDVASECLPRDAIHPMVDTV